MSLEKRERLLADKLKRRLSPSSIVVDASILSVDKIAMTCDVELPNGMVIYDVMLKSMRGESGTVVCFPTIGSSVHLLDCGGAWLVIGVEQLEELRIDASEQVVFNGGENKGMVKLTELVSRLNALEEALLDLQQKHDTHTHTTSCTAGGAVVPATTVITTKSVTKTKESDIENPKIKH